MLRVKKTTRKELEQYFLKLPSNIGKKKGILKIEGYGIYGFDFFFCRYLRYFNELGVHTCHSNTIIKKHMLQKDKIEVKNVLSYFVGLNLIKICTLGIIFLYISAMA